MENEVRAIVVGTEQVVNAWDAMNDGYPFFAIFYAKTRSKFFQYNKDNLESAKAYLMANLNALQGDGDNQLLYMNIYAMPKAVFGNSDMVASFPFRLNPKAASDSVTGAPGNLGAFAGLLQTAQNEQIKLIQELAELKAANQPLTMWDQIGGLLENPEVARSAGTLLQPVIAGLMGVISKITGAPVAPSQQFAIPDRGTPGLAGTPEQMTDNEKEQLLDETLDRLEKHGDLLDMLTTLANFADKNPGNFKMYFTMLKAQG